MYSEARYSVDASAPAVVGQKNSFISQEAALERLAPFEPPTVPVYYRNGSIDAGKGFYQLVQMPDKNRVLVYVSNLEELQLREYPGYGKLFAHSGPFYGVNAYGKSAAPSAAYTDMVEHQARVMQETREKFTLVRTGPNTYQSPTVSYVLHPKESSQPGGPVVVEAFFNSLAGKEFTPAPDHNGQFYNRARVSRIPVVAEYKDAKEALLGILNHHAQHLNKLAQGDEAIKGEGERLSVLARAALHARMYVMRVADNIAGNFRRTIDEIREKKPSSSFEAIDRIISIAKIPLLVFPSPKDVIELVSSLWQAFAFTQNETGEKSPEALGPYLARDSAKSRLNPHLHRLDPVAMEYAIPLKLKDAGITPQNAEILPGSPFDAVKDRAPDIASLRAPLGSIMHTYPNMTLLMHANGIWMVSHHATDAIYVGYNENMNTKSKPYPPPILNSWLSNEKVICYTREDAEQPRKATVMEWKEASKNLQEIIAAGDGHLLATQAPKHDPGPHIVPGPAPLDMKYLNFAGALAEHDKRMELLPVAAKILTLPAAPQQPVAPAAVQEEEHHHMRTRLHPRGTRAIPIRLTHRPGEGTGGIHQAF